MIHEFVNIMSPPRIFSRNYAKTSYKFPTIINIIVIVADDDESILMLHYAF